MTSQLDSKPRFRARAKESNLSDAFIQLLIDKSISTFGQLAFAVFRPGADFDEAEFNAWAARVNDGNAPALGELASLRRLHFESEIVATAVLRASVETADQQTSKPPPVVERAARLMELNNRLQGLNIQGSSHSLLDETCFQYESWVLCYAEPANKCTSRESDKSFRQDQQNLKIGLKHLDTQSAEKYPGRDRAHYFSSCPVPSASGDVGFAGLMTFQPHEKYVERLLRHLYSGSAARFPPNHTESSTSSEPGNVKLGGHASLEC